MKKNYAFILPTVVSLPSLLSNAQAPTIGTVQAPTIVTAPAATGTSATVSALTIEEILTLYITTNVPVYDSTMVCNLDLDSEVALALFTLPVGDTIEPTISPLPKPARAPFYGGQLLYNQNEYLKTI